MRDENACEMQKSVLKSLIFSLCSEIIDILQRLLVLKFLFDLGGFSSFGNKRQARSIYYQ